MNGVIEIFDGEQNHVLRYGLAGCTEFERLLVKKQHTTSMGVMLDLFYAGMYGEAMSKGLSTPEYSEANDLVEKLSLIPEGNTVAEKVWETYHESIYGREFKQAILDAAKKELEAVLPNKPGKN